VAWKGVIGILAHSKVMDTTLGCSHLGTFGEYALRLVKRLGDCSLN
jgi:hypothetical protein